MREDDDPTDGNPESSDANRRNPSGPPKRPTRGARLLVAVVAGCALILTLNYLRGSTDGSQRQPGKSQDPAPEGRATNPDDVQESITDASPALTTSGGQEARGKVRVLGSLGQALELVPIFANPDKNSQVVYRAKKSEYLVVQDFKFPQWRKVLLQNGKFGYVPSDLVAKLPYEVTMDAGSLGEGLASRAAAGSAVANQSLRYLGTPYKSGGNSLENGIDGSGFVKQLFGQIGIDLPRNAAEQVTVGTPITKLEDLQPGDRLYFWDAKEGKVGHAGIYLGNGYFSHASESKREVCREYLGEKKWLAILVAARR